MLIRNATKSLIIGWICFQRKHFLPFENRSEDKKVSDRNLKDSFLKDSEERCCVEAHSCAFSALIIN